jgi:glycerol-3-phosphate dehydrogenase
VFAEVERIARSRGGRSETFAGLAGAGDLVATVVAPGSRNRRAGELLAQGVPIAQIVPMLGQAVESVDTVALLTAAAREAHVDTPALDSLEALVEGRIEPERWTAAVTEPAARGRARSARAA